MAFACSLSVGHKRHARTPLNLFHLRDTLQRERNAVASHTVYAVNMERILNAMEHETLDEEELERRSKVEKERRLFDDQRRSLTRFWWRVLRFNFWTSVYIKSQLLNALASSWFVTRLYSLRRKPFVVEAEGPLLFSYSLFLFAFFILSNRSCRLDLLN